jgi:hypothetical protein
MTDELPPLPTTEYVLAREGDGYTPDRLLAEAGYTADQMHAYAQAAIPAEREACAKVCDDMPDQDESGLCASAIRARG